MHTRLIKKESSLLNFVLVYLWKRSWRFPIL